MQNQIIGLMLIFGAPILWMIAKKLDIDSEGLDLGLTLMGLFAGLAGIALILNS